MNDVDLRDQMVAAIEAERGAAVGKHVFYTPKWLAPVIAEILSPTVRRYAEAQVTAERERIAAERRETLIGYRVRLPDDTWHIFHPADVEIIFRDGAAS